MSENQQLGVDINLRTAEAIKSSLDTAVTSHIEKTGMVGPDLPALIEATEEVAKQKGSETSEIRLNAAKTNLRIAEDAVDRYKREHRGQNGDLSALLDATVKKRQALEANAK